MLKAKSVIVLLICTLFLSACNGAPTSLNTQAVPDKKEYTQKEQKKAAQELQACIDGLPGAPVQLCAFALDYMIMRDQITAIIKAMN